MSFTWWADEKMFVRDVIMCEVGLKKGDVSEGVYGPGLGWAALPKVD